MASLTPLSKGLIALAVIGGMASAVWHLGLKERLSGGSPSSPPALLPHPAPLRSAALLPAGLLVPPRFRPRSKDGLAMRGPMLCRQGDPHNIGRQFFGPVQREGGGGILWADGTQPSM